ncbi:hypothetical protein [Legionella tucsonensis]|uniref:Uncharacterized protein n=1 Tax=Legionella tucsonensis TaxID=40335 RepID=A0A0W0ZY51_9GAMM|nr:hypothetical protein [Legionella tucsonensis]KTD73776.1 hypothetical protein Ltuc_1623 [Legionella tucsonensis]
MNDYHNINYPVNYRIWLLKFIVYIRAFYYEHYNYIDVGSIDDRIFEVIYQLYQQVYISNHSHINLDLKDIKLPVCTLRIIREEDKEALLIKCTVSTNIKTLKLYRFPNLTPCPRCEAFKRVLEEYLDKYNS